MPLLEPKASFSGANFLYGKNKGPLCYFLTPIQYLKYKYSVLAQREICDSPGIVTYSTFNSEKLYFTLD